MMKSRERVLRALNHQETDRLPIDIGGLIYYTSMHVDAYKRLKAYYQIDTPTQIAVLPSQTVLIDEAMRGKLGADCYPLMLPAETPVIKVNNDGSEEYSSVFGMRFKRPKGGFYYDAFGHPLEEAETIEEIDELEWPAPIEHELLTKLGEHAKEVYEGTDYFTILNPGREVFSGCPMSIVQSLFGYESFFVNMKNDPELITYTLHRMVDYYLSFYQDMLYRYGKYIDAVVIGDDLGAQNGPLFSPADYRLLIRPEHQRLIDGIRQAKDDVKIIYHCCGAMREFIPDLAQIGVDAINPIHVSAAKMGDTAELKQEYGNMITFWGGCCDSQNILNRGTPSDVRREVAKRIRDLSGNGGLVVSSVHNVQRDVPTENIAALYEAFRDFSACE